MQTNHGLNDFAAALAGGPAFLLVGNKPTGDETEVTNYTWSGVYTSRPDVSFADSFITPNRTVLRLGPMESPPTRSPQELEVRHLFGGLQLAPNRTPGTSAVAKKIKKTEASKELNRLTSETITPKGVLIVESWGDDEELDFDELMSLLHDLGPRQVHLFSAKEVGPNAFMQYLVEQGILVTHKETLATALAQLREMGKLPTRSATKQSAHIIPIGDNFVPIEMSRWNEIRRSARPVDLEILRPPQFSSDAAKYREFRSFMGAPDGAPRWTGIAAKMNFRREFEDELETAVLAALKDPYETEPIIVTGQTATGKSIALASLAARIAASGKAAVLHQSRRIVSPSFDDIDQYSKWAEDQGAPAVLFVWDGMISTDEYTTMSRRLHGRGRKVVIVGSDYKTPKPNRKNQIEAPALLSPAELRRLAQLLNRFGIPLSEKSFAADAKFLAVLYRSLPETEFLIKHGLNQEMTAAQRGLAELVQESATATSADNQLTAVARAFKASGYQLPIITEEPAVPEARLYDASFEERNATQKLTTLVVIAGKYGLPVPFDLALRMLGVHGSRAYDNTLATYDIIRDIEDDDGQIFLTTRSRLEASLIAEDQIVPKLEAEVIKNIIDNVRLTNEYSKNHEVDFLVQLLEIIGPNGEQKQFGPFYKFFADALRARREHGSLVNPRLALQESFYLRRHLREDAVRREMDCDQQLALLENNCEMLYEVLDDTQIRGSIRTSLSVELATTISDIINTHVRCGQQLNSEMNLVSRLDQQFDAVKKALINEPTNIPAIDVFSRATVAAIERGQLTDAQVLEQAATGLALIDSIDRQSVSDADQSALDGHALKINELIGNNIDKYIDSLNRNNSTAATYILAKRDADAGQTNQAISRIENNSGTTSDWRLASLLLNLMWQNLTGTELLQKERQPIYLKDADIRKFQDLLSRLDYDEYPNAYRFNYVKAVINFLAGDHESAKRLFRNKVDPATRQLSHRMRTKNVIASEDGSAKVFSGRVEWAEGSNGELWVNNPAVKIRFNPRYFSSSGDLQINQPINRFNIGFSLSSGAVAEPPSSGR